MLKTAKRILLRRTKVAAPSAVGSVLSRHLASLPFTAKESASYQSQGLIDERNLLSFNTLHEMQERASLVYQHRDLFGTYSTDTSKYEWIPYGQFGTMVDRCRAVLKDLGVQEYDKVGIISNNRLEWATIACAAYSMNAVVVAMYEAQLPTYWSYIINDSGARVVFAATHDIFDTLQKQVIPNTPNVHAALCLDAPVGAEYAFATAMNRAAPDHDRVYVTPPIQEDLANLLYTSGTTGEPKGVELTHLNICSCIKGAGRSLVSDPHDFIRANDRTMPFLPWAHCYGQTGELFMYMAHGASMGICRGIPYIQEDLQLVQPTVLFGVPTLFKKVYDGFNTKMEESRPLVKFLMKKALQLGHRKFDETYELGPPLGLWERIQYSILDRIVLKKARQVFGGKLRGAVVGGAACPPDVIHFMDSIGTPLCEGYGLTETSPIIAVNTTEHRKIGTVGKPIGGVNVYIIKNNEENGNNEVLARGHVGEICCTGPNIMRGYHNNPQATDAALSTRADDERLFHTGDLGWMDEEGFIRVTGRIKEQYKLENGKFVVPTPIEDAIGMSRFVDQVVVAGANRPYNIALIVPNWDAIRTAIGLADDSMSQEELGNDERVQDLMQREIRSTCIHLKKYEIPREWAFVAPFTAENNMLTPKMSIRRHQVIHTYSSVISQLYGDDGSCVSWHTEDNHSSKQAAA